MSPDARLAALPAVRPVSDARVRAALAGAHRVVFLDDDPTGTQTVRDLPVLTRWGVDDIRWALRQGTAGFFVLTNTRSLAPRQAADRDREVVRACLDAADAERVELVFASRGDSTLRGHFPLETDAIGEALAERGGRTDAVVLAPAYPDAGRITVHGVHWLRSGDGEDLLPVAESEFARDATFGYRSSRLSEWVAEKSGGRIPAGSVGQVTVEDLRTGPPEAMRARLRAARDGRVIVLDAVVDDDLRAAVLAVLAAERDGASFVYRIGPSFVRARVGQASQPPLDDEELARLVGSGAHGLVVVGSHVGLTSRQLDRLAVRHRFVAVELDVPALLDEDEQRAEDHVRAAVATATAALEHDLVVLSTSRTLVTGADPAASLGIARRVSAALTDVTGRIAAARRPAFVVAKGGITSSDVATEALGIRRAWARGSLLPGIVSLWEPVAGPAAGLPYVVFAGNVGDEDALADVVVRLETAGGRRIHTDGHTD